MRKTVGHLTVFRLHASRTAGMGEAYDEDIHI